LSARVRGPAGSHRRLPAAACKASNLGSTVAESAAAADFRATLALSARSIRTPRPLEVGQGCLASPPVGLTVGVEDPQIGLGARTTETGPRGRAVSGWHRTAGWIFPKGSQQIGANSHRRLSTQKAANRPNTGFTRCATRHDRTLCRTQRWTFTRRSGHRGPGGFGLVGHVDLSELHRTGRNSVWRRSARVTILSFGAAWCWPAGTMGDTWPSYSCSNSTESTRATTQG
jgi:hypothetical protein